ncbi:MULTISPECIES: type II secretion system F family protein [Lysinibacillus]|uniref:Type II secretion system F family protein n=2 Tax=Lysinibacillus TaxID=400634 RepID=A0A2X0YXD3_9BACI|nr:MULTISPECIES: type II secretion system F family protein [Lysinibacillus]AUS85866.1 type II secretion system F family protein [Lysinibacillus sp. YS11]KGR81285.1 type II secretion system protein F [Lysinibacillus boronitolerans JCM 21713 = 10a = NBRC 103108]KMN40871.1 type II secretion system protein F [Lysinibacillus sp. LK3]MBX8943786.1 type II secretion system F family protein [Lysinibacillus sp. K60]MCM0623723.1 type II secretion system F family protein [Lysinibacillus sp. OL1_EC]
MTIFRYSGRTKTGAPKKGIIEAPNKKVAMEKLRAQGINARELQESNSILHKDIAFGTKVKHQEFVIYCRQYATLIRAGVPVVEATHILGEQTRSKPLKRALMQVEEDIRNGMAFSDAAGKHPKVFPLLFVNMMRAGEATGNVDDTLDRLASTLEKQYNIKKKIQSAMTYPAILSLLTLVVGMFLMVFIVPTFMDAFKEMNLEMPLITVIVVGISDWLIQFWYLVILGLLVLVVGLHYFYKNNKEFHYAVNVFLLRMPIFGQLLQKDIIARMTRTLSTLFSSSVPILQALTIVEKVGGNPVMGKVVLEARDNLEKGGTLSEPLEKSWLFPPLVTQMTSIGEKTGSLDYMLEKIADFYEEEVNRAVDTMKSLIEPLMIVVLALVVGVIVAAIFLPMFQLYENM